MNANPVGITHRLRGAAEWRLTALKSRVRTIRSDNVRDQFRCWLQLGFALPALDNMQNYARLKFLHDCIVRFAPGSGTALELGCYKCSSTVFVAQACRRAEVPHVCAIDLFTGTQSWGLDLDYQNEAQQKLARYGLVDRVTLIRSNTLNANWTEPISALHIDADHAYEAVWADISKYAPFVVQDGIIVFDDYDADHPGVTKAVHRLLVEDTSFEVAAANYQGYEFGSVCLRRVRSRVQTQSPVAR
jgi:predicted O-methyltransferase YrrM